MTARPVAFGLSLPNRALFFGGPITWDTLLAASERAETSGAGAITAERLESWLAFGPPQAVIDTIGEFLDAGCTTPVLRFTSPDQLGQLERCIAEVLPAFNH